MKKSLLLYISILLLFLLTACGKDKKNDEKTKENFASEDQNTTESVNMQTATQTEPVSDENTEEMIKDADGFYVVDDYIITVGDTINVRVSPSTDANIYALLGGGEVLRRTGYNEEWVRVIMDSTSFYIHSELVELTEAPANAIDENDDGSDEEKLEKKIIIDPANQMNPNNSKESIGLNSEETKQGAVTGDIGATFGTKEYELNLIYANALKEELEKRGYEVILTRDANDVDLTNKSRAEAANESGATSMIRLQTSYSVNAELSGVMAITMSGDSPYNSNLYSDSKKLATRILQGTIAKTGAINNGIYETNQMTVINWSEIPVVAISYGYLSSSQDEGNLLDDNYRNSVITGIADGIDNFYN